MRKRRSSQVAHLGGKEIGEDSIVVRVGPGHGQNLQCLFLEESARRQSDFVPRFLNAEAGQEGLDGDVVYDPGIARWLAEEWDQSLDWDEANVGELAKHSAAVEQIESLFDGSFGLGGRITPPLGTEWSEQRFVLFGQAEGGRN